MPSILSRYTHWLHTCWPAGTVERLPACDEDGRTNVPGVRLVGDLTGIPLLKFSSETGARAAREISDELKSVERGTRNAETFDLAIIGGGVAGISAAIEAKKAGLKFVVFEGTQVFSTVANFPKAKPIYTYPTDMTPSGGLQFRADLKEALLDEMEAQRRAAGVEIVPARIERIGRNGDALTLHHADGKSTQARRVIVAIGRSGNFRKLGCHGEDLPKVFNRLHDPKEFAGKNLLVVGGGDTALETAIALGACGAHVTLSYRQKDFSRPKPENIEKLRALEQNAANPVQIEKPTSERISTALTLEMQKTTPTGSVKLLLGSTVEQITMETVTLRDADGQSVRLMNDIVFTMLGREAPLDFFRRSGLAIRGEWTAKTWAAFILFALFCVWLYHWKSDGSAIYSAFKERHWFPFNVSSWLTLPVAAFGNSPSLLLLKKIAGQPSFYYSLAYCTLIVVFGVRRIMRRRTPYVTAQTLSLIAFQILPLFLLPYLLLPWMGAVGMFDAGLGKSFADQFFPIPSYSPEREYWRAFGFVLAWPLFIWNLFNDHPTTGWLVLGLVQTFVIIPLIVWRWGKGAYCGWICSCGALAETLGDTHREKMPHGPRANRWNMTGQVILGIAMFLLVLRILGWLGIEWFNGIYYGLLSGWPIFNYAYIVDLWLAGVVGVAAYFWFSGRVWCRFACPLAALMHIYTRFSRYRIFADKKKCISCNVCTSVCHQGIDVMNFANKGMPMEDPQCVRCSACVQQCPTGVLSFGRIGHAGVPVLDRLAASPVQTREVEA